MEAIAGYRRWLWLLLAFISGVMAPIFAGLSFYLPIPFVQMPLAIFFIATPLTFPAFAIIKVLSVRKRSIDRKPDGGVITLMAMAEFALIIMGVVVFYTTIAKLPLIENIMDIGGHIA